MRKPKLSPIGPLLNRSLTHSKSFLHFSLNDSIERFNHVKGIISLIKWNLLAKELIPTLLLLFFKILNIDWHDVKIWLKFIVTNSTGLKSWLYILKRQSANSYATSTKHPPKSTPTHSTPPCAPPTVHQPQLLKIHQIRPQPNPNQTNPFLQ